MKTVIIGSGIAGLAMARLLQQQGHEVVVNERQGGVPVKGNAFLINEEGMDILQSLAPATEIPGLLTNAFHRFKPTGRMVTAQQMDPWYCSRRSDLVLYLSSLVKPGTVKYGRKFSHFIYKGTKAVAAVFENGQVEYGDLFVGADGCHSQVRQLLFGKTSFTEVQVREVLGMVVHPELATSRKGIFSKFQCEDKGLSFGFIPVTDNELIWFSQMDVKLADQPPAGAEALKHYMKNLLVEFQEPVQELLDATDFSSAYVWNTTDFDTLPSFHRSNVVLVGDAAHLALPFTSAGVTNALKDVKALLKWMAACDGNFEEGFQQYYQERMPVVEEHLQTGREMKRMFLEPNSHTSLHTLPLVPKQPQVPQKQEQLEVLYFTDPICSTCWTIQPQLRKIKMEYKGRMEFEYKMSGLLPGWKGFERHGIHSPADVALHWEEASLQSGMPIDGSVWVEDPLESSYPPSRAFKAAQLQGHEKALEFLRILNEAVFMQKKNITSPELLQHLAHQAGLDAGKLMEDLELQGELLFREDLRDAKSLEISFLPTLVFKLNGKYVGKLSGTLDYESILDFIKKLDPKASKKTIDLNARQLFNAYSSLTTKEYAFIMGVNLEEAELQLNELLQEGGVEKQYGSKGVIWKAGQKNHAA